MKNIGSNPIALFDQQSNQDLKVDSTLFQSSGANTTQYASNQKLIRRRPQTTKRIISGAA